MTYHMNAGNLLPGQWLNDPTVAPETLLAVTRATFAAHRDVAGATHA